MLRKIGVELVLGVAGGGELRQNVGRLGKREIIIDVVADAREGYAPRGGVTGIGEGRDGELEIGVGERIGVLPRLQFGCGVFGGLQAIGVDALEISDRRSGARVAGAAVDPQRREAAIAIEGLDRVALVLAIEITAALVGEEIAQLLGDTRVRGGKRSRDRRLDEILAGIDRRRGSLLLGLRWR